MDEAKRYRPFWGATVIADLNAVAAELSLQDFDLLLIGDGSGTVFNKACGWACVSWNRLTEDIEMHNGSSSCGTNNFAELIPYVQALWHFDQCFRQLALPGQKAKIEIVSDSEVTVRCGNGIYARKGNACLWSAIEWFERSGIYNIHWNHVHRNTNRFSKRCDWLAGETRTALNSLRKKLLDE